MDHGEVRQFFTNELHKSLEKVINAKSDRDRPYYICVVIKDGYDGRPANRSDNHLLNDNLPVDGERTLDLSGKKVVSNRIIILESAPKVPLINSSLWYVDNKIGLVRCCYILPPDRPAISGFDVGEESELVFNCGKNMPIAYGS